MLTIQFRIDDPAFPALSHATARIRKVPETSAGTFKGYVPEGARFFATVSHERPYSFEIQISTPAIPAVSVACQITWRVVPGIIER